MEDNFLFAAPFLPQAQFSPLPWDQAPASHSSTCGAGRSLLQSESNKEGTLETVQTRRKSQGRQW